MNDVRVHKHTLARWRRWRHRPIYIQVPVVWPCFSCFPINCDTSWKTIVDEPSSDSDQSRSASVVIDVMRSRHVGVSLCRILSRCERRVRRLFALTNAFSSFQMSIAILNDPQLSNDVYDLLISQAAPALAQPACRAQPCDFLTVNPDTHSECLSNSITSLSLLLRL